MAAGYANDETAHVGEIAVGETPGNVVVAELAFDRAAGMLCDKKLIGGRCNDHFRGEKSDDSEFNAPPKPFQSPSNITYPSRMATVALLGHIGMLNCPCARKYGH